MSEVSFSSVALEPVASFGEVASPLPRREPRLEVPPDGRADEPMPPRGVTPLPVKAAALRSLLHLPHPVPGAARRSPWFDVCAKGAILLGLAAAFSVAMARNKNPLFGPAVLDFSSASAFFWQLSGLVGLVYFVLTSVFALRYRPVPTPADAALPKLTVVVPAYNEGAMVRVALLSALENRYPAERLEILAIDDGSTDDTWEHIQAVARAFPGRIVPVKQPKNGGKREALRTGFVRATGEFVVTVDSDSQLDPDALRNIVAPMLIDESVHAVAGKVLVLNRYDNLFTRFLSARFFVTFDLLRAAQSRFGAVLCTPGALSAYRMTGVRHVLADWASQEFLGVPCTIGEDRALNTWLLRQGHRAVYQANAMVRTVMPTEFRRIAKMMTRWERGNIREDLVMLPVLATNWRSKDRLWPTFEILLEIMQYPATTIAFAMSLHHFFVQPSDIARVVVGLGVGALIQSLYALRSERSTDFVYGVGYAFWAFIGLQWISPYSFLTLRDGRWMTR